MKDFAQKVAVITGAGSGMGRYLALLIAKAGGDVVICDVNEDSLAETKTMLNKYNVAISSHTLDVADKDAIKALPEKVIAQHGKVDMVFNNAGVTYDSSFEDLEEDQWDFVMDVNLHGVVNMTRAFMPYLRQQPEAAIVNTSSIFGMVAVPRQSVYHATKYAVRGFTESLVKETKDSSIQVHCVHPGHIGTNILSSAKFNENTQQEPITSKIFGIGTRDEMGEAFKKHGMHPSRAADMILRGVKNKKSRIFIGLDAKLIDLSQRILPNHYEKLWPIFMLPLFFLRNKKAIKDI
jgi:NADP-dependent 3-hydroxy acid dehydrogenase YdfG